MYSLKCSLVCEQDNRFHCLDTSPLSQVLKKCRDIKYHVSNKTRPTNPLQSYCTKEKLIEFPPCIAKIAGRLAPSILIYENYSIVTQYSVDGAVINLQQHLAYVSRAGLKLEPWSHIFKQSDRIFRKFVVLNSRWCYLMI